MPRVAIVACVLLLTAPLASAQDAKVEHGKKVYAAQKCDKCHSIGGVGNKKGALDDVATKITADEMRLWITDAPAMQAKAKSKRKPAMKAYKLSPDDLDALVAYLMTLKG
jgi:mono/diheme cytochrome c family protein